MRRLVVVSGPGEASEAEAVLAREVGAAVAARGWVLLTGGRNAGVMAAASAGARSRGGLSVGILPGSRADAAPDLDVAIVTGLGSARNNVLVLSADAVVAIGAASPGTLSEIALAVKAGKPVVVVGADAAARAFLSRFPAVAFAEGAAEAMAAVERFLATP